MLGSTVDFTEAAHVDLGDESFRIFDGVDTDSKALQVECSAIDADETMYWHAGGLSGFVPVVVEPINLTNWSSTIALTTLSSRPGFYVVEYVMTCTTGSPNAASVTFNVSAIGDGGLISEPSDPLPMTSAPAIVSGRVERFLVNGPLQFSVTAPGSIGSARYALRVRTTFTP